MAIPTFSPGQLIGPNSVSVRKYNPNGDLAEANMWGDVAHEMGKVAQTFSDIETRRALEEAEAEGIRQASNPDFDPEVLKKQAITSADRAFRKGATTAYLSNLDMQTDQELVRINAESSGDPDLLFERMKTHIDSVSQQMPEVIAMQFKEGALRQANGYYTNALSGMASRVRSQQKTDILAGIELSESKLEQIGSPGSAEAEEQFSLEGAKYRVKLQSAVEAGFITENEALLRQSNLQDKMLDVSIKQAVFSAPDRLDFAMKVAAGESGTDFDNLPVNKRYNAVTAAQQFINAENSAQSLRDQQMRELVSSQVLQISDAVLSSPEDSASVEAVQRAISIANTPETVDQAYKLRDYIQNPNAARFQPLSGEYQEHLEYKAALGSLDQRTVNNAFGADMPDNRIGVEGWRALTSELSARPSEIVGGNAWKTFTERLESEFPVPQRSSKGLAGLAASLGLDVTNINIADGMDGVSEKQKQENRRLLTQVLRDTQQKISDGDIDSESSLTQYATQKLGELRQQFGAASLNQNNRVKSRGPATQAAFVVMGSDEETRRMYQKYKDDRKGFLRDVNAGKIDMRTANTINRLLSDGE